MIQILRIISRFQGLESQLNNPIAIKYLKFGFNIRAIQIKEIVFQLNEAINKAGSEPFDPYESVRINILINSYYLNILGAVDNLAWVILHEFDLISGATESNSKKHDINLFRKNFKKALSKYSPGIVEEVVLFESWFDEIKKFRNPAAHRMPILCLARVIGSEYKELSKAVEKPESQDYLKNRKEY